MDVNGKNAENIATFFWTGFRQILKSGTSARKVKEAMCYCVLDAPKY
jgi:hypothetical protein